MLGQRTAPAGWPQGALYRDLNLRTASQPFTLRRVIWDRERSKGRRLLQTLSFLLVRSSSVMRQRHSIPRTLTSTRRWHCSESLM